MYILMPHSLARNAKEDQDIPVIRGMIKVSRLVEPTACSAGYRPTSLSAFCRSIYILGAKTKRKFLFALDERMKKENSIKQVNLY